MATIEGLWVQKGPSGRGNMNLMPVREWSSYAPFVMPKITFRQPRCGKCHAQVRQPARQMAGRVTDRTLFSSAAVIVSFPLRNYLCSYLLRCLSRWRYLLPRPCQQSASTKLVGIAGPKKGNGAGSNKKTDWIQPSDLLTAWQ